MFLHFLFLYTFQDIFNESFVLVNKLHGNKAITLVNHTNDLTLPIRLLEISNDNLMSQLWQLRFNMSKNFWLVNIHSPLYRSIEESKHLVAKKNLLPGDTNLKLKYVSEDTYKIISGGLCLTVGEINKKNEVEYYPLEFSKCNQADNQGFIFIPRILVEKYNNKERASAEGDDEVNEAYRRLNKELNVAHTYVKEE
ncbi:ricin B lectin (RBL1) [Vairimorpha necatrix]|uniref:Ricin B lectin (RBL1) n=1 Tax=Vairimorpha necatrix TaxID=6039 RepID=A0AAX4JFB0_9MICR